MDDLVIRAARDEDEAVVQELCLLALAPADTEDQEGLRRLLWQTPGVIGLVAESGGSVVGAAFGTVTEDKDAAVAGAITLLAVHPEQSRRGVGSALLAALEGRLWAVGAQEIWAGGGQPRFWWPGIDTSDAGTIRFFERAGYLPDDDAVNMRVDLAHTGLPTREPEGLSIRRLTPEEWPAFLGWMEHTWDDPWGAEVRTTLDRTPVSCYVAERDGRYLGFAAYDTNRRGWFGPMGSSPDARGTGLGSALLRRCLRDFVELGRTSCEIGWVGPVDFYVKTVGATISRSFVLLRKDAPK